MGAKVLTPVNSILFYIILRKNVHVSAFFCFCLVYKQIHWSLVMQVIILFTAGLCNFCCSVLYHHLSTWHFLIIFFINMYSYPWRGVSRTGSFQIRICLFVFFKQSSYHNLEKSLFTFLKSKSLKLKGYRCNVLEKSTVLFGAEYKESTVIQCDYLQMLSAMLWCHILLIKWRA